MIAQSIARIGMGEDDQVAAIERQPGYDLGEMLRRESNLIGEHRMRTDRVFVETTHLHLAGETLRDGFAQGRCEIARSGIEIDVRVPGLDFCV